MTKQELRQYRHLNTELRDIEERIIRLRARLESPKVLSFGQSRSGRGNEDQAANLIAKLIDLEQRYTRKWDDLIERQEQVEDAIDTLDVVERVLIRTYYLDGMTWERVARVIGYTSRQTLRIHGTALKKLAET